MDFGLHEWLYGSVGNVFADQAFVMKSWPDSEFSPRMYSFCYIPPGKSFLNIDHNRLTMLDILWPVKHSKSVSFKKEPVLFSIRVLIHEFPDRGYEARAVDFPPNRKVALNWSQIGWNYHLHNNLDMEQLGLVTWGTDINSVLISRTCIMLHIEANKRKRQSAILFLNIIIYIKM